MIFDIPYITPNKFHETCHGGFVAYSDLGHFPRESLFACVTKEMKIFRVMETWVLLLSCIFLSSGIDALAYNYLATTKCIGEPWKALYEGGILPNPEFTHGIEGWTVFGEVAVKEELSKNGNRYIVAYNRTKPLHGISQTVQFENKKLYSFSAWIQTSEGTERVAIVFRTARGEIIRGGQVTARNGCWSMLKGGAVANFSGPVDVLFESNNTKKEIWVDNVSLQPFTMEQWRSHQNTSIDKERKSKVKFRVTDANKTAMDGALVSIRQTKSGFPFGCGMNDHILQSTDYQNWFALRFKYTTFTNQMKWYYTEKVRGIENYTAPDAMVTFCKQNGISIRGHNIFWDDPKYQPDWVKTLSPDELREAAAKRINSVVSRYSGQLIAWDVMNENLHFSFYEDQLGKNASAEYFSIAHKLDPETVMFMNEYNTIENCNDQASTPDNYIKKLYEILSYPGNERIPIGIGLQGHFSSNQPNLPYMRAVMDILGSIGYPLWLTEVDVDRTPNQAEYLEQILREGYSHPAVQGIIMFAGPAIAGFNVTMLANRDFENTPSGDVVDRLIDEWETKSTETKTDTEGFLEISLHHGDYEITVKHPVTSSSTSTSHKVTKDVPGTTVNVLINV